MLEQENITISKPKNGYEICTKKDFEPKIKPTIENLLNELHQ